MPLFLKNIEAEYITVPTGSVKTLSLSSEFGIGDYIDIDGITAFLQDYSKSNSIISLSTPPTHGFLSEIEYEIEADSPESTVEDIIYLQTSHKCKRNSNTNTVNSSSDICIFNAPKFTISGTSKIIDDYVICEFSGVSPDNIFTAATDECYTGSPHTLSCFSSQTWTTYIYEDDELADSNIFFYSTSTGDTPTQTQVVNSIDLSFNSLGYEYDKDDTTFEIQKPFGVTDLRVEICLLMENNGSICTDCDEYCTTGCSDTFETLTSGSSNVYIIDTGDTIDVEVSFTADTNSFTGTNAEFKYEVYKFNHESRVFEVPAVYQSEDFLYEEFSASTSFTENIPISGLSLDGDYLIKGYYEHDVCSEFINYLDLRHDTSLYKFGSEYDLYDKTYDHYFVAINDAEEPILNTSTNNVQPIGRLTELTYFPDFDGQTTFNLGRRINPDSVVTLNGLTMADGYDYEIRLSGDTAELEFSASTYTGDVINVIYATEDNNVGLVNDVIRIDSSITSGTTDGEGSNDVYFNTDTSKYELFTTTTPVDANDIIVSLNGVTLANNIDYYQSISNPKRIILEGIIYVGDVINITYNGYPEFVGDIFTQTPTIYWSVENAPELSNGRFVVEVSSAETFNNIVTSAETSYSADVSAYSADITLSGSVGTQYYYRVVNHKEYVSLTGDVIKDDKYSEIVPITIQSNSLNSY